MPDADAVRGVLLDALPPGTPVDRVYEYAKAEGLECSGLMDGTVRMSAPARGKRPWVSAKWLIVVTVADLVVADIDVTLGLTGP